MVTPPRVRLRLRSTSTRLGVGGSSTVAAAFLLWLSYSALWAICQPVAVGLGLSDEKIGYLFSIATFAGLIGGLIAWVLGEKAGRILPLIASAAALGACCAILTATSSIAVYS
jgi:hypothetical protein